MWLPLPWVEVGEGLICIIHSVSPSPLGGGGGGAHLHKPQCGSLYLGWRWGRGSFVSSTVCLPLPWVEVGEGLICISHSVSSLYLGWWWGRGSFASSTVCLPLPRVGYTQCHTRWVEGGGAHLHHPSYRSSVVNNELNYTKFHSVP